MIILTVDEFKNETGITDLLNLLPTDYGNEGTRESNFIKRQSQIIDRYIRNRCPNYTNFKMSAYRISQVKLAIIEQCLYVINTNDYTLISGYNRLNNSLISQENRNALIVGPEAQRILLASGLLYSGI